MYHLLGIYLFLELLEGIQELLAVALPSLEGLVRADLVADQGTTHAFHTPGTM